MFDFTSIDDWPEADRPEVVASPTPAPDGGDVAAGGLRENLATAPEDVATVPSASEAAESACDDEPPKDAQALQVVLRSHEWSRQVPALRDCVRTLPEAVLRALYVGRDQDDEPFLQIDGRSIVHRLRDPGTRVILAQAVLGEDRSIRPPELQIVIDEIEGWARLYAQRHHVWVGVAPNAEGGVDIDLADDDETIARVVPGRHYLLVGNTKALFYRTPRMLRRLCAKEGGDFYRIFRYLKHLRFEDQRLVAAWVLYSLAHAKVPTTVFIHLILFGPQGSGKTVLAEMLMAIISPSSIGVQPLPRSAVDLAIAAAQGGLCAFDNVRALPLWLSDMFCLMATSGVVTARKLYSNEGQAAINLHCPAMLTSLHAVVTEPDLADRCLQVNVPPMDATKRRDPTVLMQEFERDRPVIFRGALQLIADIYQQLPLVEPVNPQRVYRFSHWLAALERVEGVPAGAYQKWYAEALGQVMLDSLHESSLNVAVLDFMEGVSERVWTGTAAELLTALNRATGRRASSGGDWPVNEIALARRLRASVAAFRTQGIDIQFTRGRVRRITITRIGGGGHD